MKNWGLQSSKSKTRRVAFPPTAMAILFMTVALIPFCHPPVSAASVICSGRQADCPASEKQSEETDLANEPVGGKLVLADPTGTPRYAEYEMAVGDSFSITFVHSVNKSPVSDFFEIREDGIYGIKTIYYGFGAGVPTELEEGQTLTYGDDGSMIISGMEIKLDNLIYRVGTVSDHILTLSDQTEISLRDLCGRNARVSLCFEPN